MPRQPIGVRTIPGFLTSQLDELDLSRKDLAQAVGVSVRTIHNIEYGRKRVDAAVLARVAAALNERSLAAYPAAPPLALTEHHFIVDPKSVVEVAMQAITLNRPDFLRHDDAQVEPSLRWWINGDPERLAWTGLFDLSSLGGQIDEFHRCFEFAGVEETQLFLAPRGSSVILKTVSKILHPCTRAMLKYKSFIEFDVAGDKLRAMDATFDSELVATFLETGAVPRRRMTAEPLPHSY